MFEQNVQRTERGGQGDEEIPKQIEMVRLDSGNILFITMCPFTLHESRNWMLYKIYRRNFHFFVPLYTSKYQKTKPLSEIS